jgi:hypothetical protein
MNRLVFAFLPFLLGLSGVFSLQSSPKTPPSTSASSRRQWLASTAGIVTVAATTSVAANANPSIVSKVQGPIQDIIAPGHWIGQFVGLNSRKETWDFPNNTPEEVSKAMVDVLEGLTPERRAKLIMPEFEIKIANDKKIHVLTWTKLEWLDTLDVTLAPTSSKDGCVAIASFYATGFLPTNIPLAPLLNVAMAWFPFASPGPRGEMLQDFRLRAIKGLVTKKLQEKIVTPDLYV